MTFTVHSLFKTIQGEGYHTGRPAVFCRFAGCNLWSGREEDRANAICKFCDTEFRHGTKYPMCIFLAEAIEACWGDSKRNRTVVMTGGEPGLQITPGLIDALNEKLFAVHVETNGTIQLPDNCRWITVSPKAGTRIYAEQGDELKVVWPQDVDLEKTRERIGTRYCYLQPMDGPKLAENTRLCIDYVLAHPWWHLSLQTHKFAGIA